VDFGIDKDEEDFPLLFLYRLSHALISHLYYPLERKTEHPRAVSQCFNSVGDGHQYVEGANISNLPFTQMTCDRLFAHYSLVVSFTLGHPRSICSVLQHRQHRHFRTSTNTPLSPSSTPFRLSLSSSVFLHQPSIMANNTESSHRRSTSAVSSVDEAASNDGTLSGPASTVPTAKSTPFIGPQNHPGIPAQHHPNPVTGLILDNGDILQISLLDDTPFASQLDEVEGQIRMLGWNDSPYPPDRNTRYRYVFEPHRCPYL
jgi:hypothetical protein